MDQNATIHFDSVSRLDQNATKYLQLLNLLGDERYNVYVSEIKSSLMDYLNTIYKVDVENKYGEPMLFIGIYIAIASLVCIIAMVVDLGHGLRSRKLWMPCKYSRINATSLALVAIAMKLPVDLSGSMPGVVDQVTKLGSLAFMCTMMANSLPSLATMDNKQLLANIAGLIILVITLVVNIIIQILTGVVKGYKEKPDKLIETVTTGGYPDDLQVINKVTYSTIAIIYVTMLLMWLLIYVCSSLAILRSKLIIESKYKHAHQTASNKAQQSPEKSLTVDELEKHVRNYWIMAESGNPQFIIACSATTTASGVICSLTTILHTLTVVWTIVETAKGQYPLVDSNYKWSMLLIFIVQFIGVILGTIAPLFRCFASLSFKVSKKSILDHIKVFNVESYWLQKLSDWKYDSKRFRFRRHKRNVVLKNLKSLILNIAITLQFIVVAICKIIALIPFFAMICIHFLMLLLRLVFRPSGKSTTNVGESLYDNVLLLEDGMELAEKTLKDLLKSLNRVIQKGEKKQPNNLLKLIEEKSTKGFQGVIKSDNDDHRNCWSLDVVTLTTIAVTLGEMKKVKVKSLLKSVREGLEYVTLVEKNLKPTGDCVSIRKAAEALWEEVDDFRHKWLGIKLKHIKVNPADGEEDVTMQVVKFFFKEAENKSKEAENKSKEGTVSADGEGPNVDSKLMSICPNAMSRITEAIIDDHKESHKISFDELISSRIADTIAACLTNLPKVIAEKYDTSVIEKREASVKAAAQLLGETKEIIRILQDSSRHVPTTNTDDVLN